MRRTVFVALLTLVLLGCGDMQDTQMLKGSAAFGDWEKDKPGVRRLLTPQDLPPIGPSTSTGVEIVPRPRGEKPIAPEGFLVKMVTSGLAGPRVIRTAPNGDLFVAESKSNSVRVYRIPPGNAKPISDNVFASGLNKPFGIAFYPLGANPEWIYIANTNGVVRFPYKNGDLKATGEAQKVVEDIPSVYHWTRDLVFSPDGKRMFLSVGSGSNVALDMAPGPRIDGGLETWKKTKPLGAAWDTEERRADVLSFEPDGKDEKIFATGLRNCVGLTVQPTTGELWCAVNERDEIGDDVPFEYATHIEEGAFYGWPWFYIGANEDPNHKDTRPDSEGQGDNSGRAH